MARHFGEGVEAFPVFNGTGANVVGLQSMLPRWGAVIARDDRAHQRRRGRCARAGRRHQAAHRADRRRQAHPRAHRPRGLGLGRRAPRTAARRLDHAVHRARHAVHARRDPRDRRPRPRARHAPAPRRRPHRQRRGIPRPAAARLHARRRRRRPELRRHQERRDAAARRSSCSTPRHPTGLQYLRKLNMQLSSKMRFVSAQLIALLEGDLWLRNARHSNAMAAAAARRRRGRHRRRLDPRRRLHAADAGERRVRDRARRGRRSPARDRSASTTGMPRRTRCAGCAVRHDARPTSTRSSPRSPERRLPSLRTPDRGRAPCAGRERGPSRRRQTGVGSG